MQNTNKNTEVLKAAHKHHARLSALYSIQHQLSASTIHENVTLRKPIEGIEFGADTGFDVLTEFEVEARPIIEKIVALEHEAKELLSKIVDRKINSMEKLNERLAWVSKLEAA